MNGTLSSRQDAKADSLKPILLGLAAFVVVMAVGLFALYVFLWIISSAVSEIAAIDSDVAKAVVAGSFAVIVAALSAAIPRYFEQKSRTTDALRDKKAEVNQSFYEFLFMKVLGGSLAGRNKVPEDDMKEFMLGFIKDASVWASDDVLKSLSVWRQRSSAGVNTGGFGPLDDMMKVLLAMRRDLGHSNTGVNPETLLTLYVNDLSSARELAEKK